MNEKIKAMNEKIKATNEKVKEMIRMATEDGVITEKERTLILKKAKDLGEDEDMVEFAIEGELGQLKKDVAKTASKGEKCPNCGSIIPSGSAVCTSCGFVLVSRKINSTVLELQKDLNQIDKSALKQINSIKKKYANVSMWKDSSESDIQDFKKQVYEMKSARICNTVVPNNRADLLDILAFTAPKANRLGAREYVTGLQDADDLSYAYWQLFENCILRAQTSFMNDPSFQPFYVKYKRMTEKQPFEWFRTQSIISKLTIICFALILLIMFICFIGMICDMLEG